MAFRSLNRVTFNFARNLHRGFPREPTPRYYNSSAQPDEEPIDIESLLREPTWSVRSLFPSDEASTSSPTVDGKQLRHLLELSALPPPKNKTEEEKMIKDLQAQLRFVQTIQSVDTEGIEPLQAIRDETEEGRKRRTFTVDSLKEEFAKEEKAGKRGRIRRRKTTEDEASSNLETASEKKWDPLSHAKKTQGRYFVVDTEHD